MFANKLFSIIHESSIIGDHNLDDTKNCTSTTFSFLCSYVNKLSQVWDPRCPVYACFNSRFIPVLADSLVLRGALGYIVPNILKGLVLIWLWFLKKIEYRNWFQFWFLKLKEQFQFWLFFFSNWISFGSNQITLVPSNLLLQHPKYQNEKINK